MKPHEQLLSSLEAQITESEELFRRLYERLHAGAVPDVVPSSKRWAVNLKLSSIQRKMLERRAVFEDLRRSFQVEES